MRLKSLCASIAILVAFGCLAGIAQAKKGGRSKGPTAAEIRRAITNAERSKQLWATVNVCKPKGRNGSKGGSIGIRGQMPTLGFRATLSMTIQLNSYSTTTKSYQPIPSPNAATTVSPGTFASNLHQDGAVFPFTNRAGLLNATVTFTWIRGRRTLGTATRTTTAGHRDAAGGIPPHYSAANCRLG